MRSSSLAVGVTQGHYGDHGNLELVVPDAERGFRVLWLNGDDAATAEVAPRGWSGGFHIDTGGPVDGVRIAQVAEGPWFLEATLLQEGEARRWTWRPDLGFVPNGTIAPSTCAPSAVVAAGGALHVLTASRDGVRHHVAATDTYPDLHWSMRSNVPVADPVTSLHLASTASDLQALVVAGGRATLHDLGATGRSRTLAGRWSTADLDGPAPVGLDGEGRLLGVEGLSGRFDAIAATRSTLDGGTLEIVGLRDGELLHARVGRAGVVPFARV